MENALNVFLVLFFLKEDKLALEDDNYEIYNTQIQSEAVKNLLWVSKIKMYILSLGENWALTKVYKRKWSITGNIHNFVCTKLGSFVALPFINMPNCTILG